MANPNMKDAGYWYGDEDVNAVVDVLRKKTSKPLSYGTHVIILDAVCADGVKGTDARNLEWNLSKHVRLNDTEYLTILHHVLTELQPITVDSVSALMEKDYAHINDDVKQKIVARLNFPDGKTELSAENKKNLEQKVKKEIEQASGTDPFDDISADLKKGDSKFSILFPYNLANRHWVLGEIDIKREGDKVTVEFNKYDSVGGGEFSAEEFNRFETTVKSRLKDILVGKDFVFQIDSVKNLGKATQNDGSSCGPITLQNLALRAEGKSALSDKVPSGASALRTQQYDLISAPHAETKLPAAKAADKNGKWNDHSVQEVKNTFAEVFKDVKKAELVHDTIKTTDLSDDNLEAFVSKTKALMDTLALKGSVEINVSPETKRSKLEELCRKYKLDFTSNAKEEASAPAEAERSAVRPSG